MEIFNSIAVRIAALRACISDYQFDFSFTGKSLGIAYLCEWSVLIQAVEIACCVASTSDCHLQYHPACFASVFVKESLWYGHIVVAQANQFPQAVLFDSAARLTNLTEIMFGRDSLKDITSRFLGGALARS